MPKASDCETVRHFDPKMPFVEFSADAPVRPDVCIHSKPNTAIWRRIDFASLQLFTSAGMQAEAVEFFAHRQTGDAEPAGGLGLVTLSELDRLGEELALGSFDEGGVSVLDFAVTGCGEQLGDTASQRLAGDAGRGRSSAGAGRFFETDRVPRAMSSALRTAFSVRAHCRAKAAAGENATPRDESRAL